MTRSPRQALLAAAAALLCTAAPAAAAPTRPAQLDPRPNIVVIMTDDQTVHSMKVMRNLNLGIRRAGTTFSQAISTYPLCCPSRATYLTGQYSHNHGVIHNAGPFGGYVRLDNTNTLPVWLQQSGYRTIHVGRYLNGYGTQNPDLTEIPPGWSDWHSTIDPYTFNFAEWRMNENGVISREPGPDNPGEFQTDFLGRRASKLIDRAAPSRQPFFLSLTFPAPHSGSPRDPDDPVGLRTPSPAPRHRDFFSRAPLPRPPNFDEGNVYDKPQIVADRGRIRGEIFAAVQENYQQELESLLSVDDAVGNVLAALSRSGELENTLIIYTSDNGFFHGEHRVRSEKILPYEPGLRVPLVMRGPGVPPNRRLRQMVGNIDLAPTILEAAGATPGRVVDGRSLLELTRDPTFETGRELVIENGRGVNSVPMFRALRNNRFLYVEHGTTGETELYDLQVDPYELRNLEDSLLYAPVRQLLARRLRSLKRCAGSRCNAGRPSVRLALRELEPARKKGRRPARRNQTCVARGLRLGLAGRERSRVERVKYLLGRRRLAASRRSPFSADVRPSRLPAGRELRVRARVVTRDGRVVTVDRPVTTCRR
ncbi:MAG TPA: sulfatase [Thermoleophilaceae bacterium]|nr:sulfatase [Thermoleophilaceae bacterium]